MPLTLTQDLEVSNIFAHYKSDIETIKHLHETNEDPRSIVRGITSATDSLVIDLLTDRLLRTFASDELPGHILLLAQGGYGRREMHPKSDVDLLFLHQKELSKKEADLIKGYYQLLFDLGFQVGHCCRSFKEALDITPSDAQSLTAMAESRFLIGDWRLFEKFKDDLWRNLYRTHRENIRIKIKERAERCSRQGITINISEPNIKESTGGLRDYHFGLWLGSLHLGRTMNLLHLTRSHLIDDRQRDKVDRAVAFLWRLRTALHFHTGKEQDVLAMPLQHDISLKLGYQDRRGRLAEEAMMRDYYKHALAISRFAETIQAICTPKPLWKRIVPRKKRALSDGFSIYNNEIHIPHDLHFYEHNPQRILQTFIHVAGQKAILAPETAEILHDNRYLVDQPFLHDKHNAALLRKFFSLSCPIEAAFHEMRKIGMIECLFPEWRDIVFLVRYDLVHRYTVDEHSLMCLYHLEHLFGDKMNYSQERFFLWHEGVDREILRLAVLFHDIGKGRSGDHSIIGARLADTIARRMRLPEEKRNQLVFLIRHHLLMSHTAQHHDLTDPQVKTDFSDSFKTLEDLNMLYLLTYVDMRSVSPESMTEWKNNLLWQLYLSARNVFLSETVSAEEEKVQRVSRKERIIESLSSEFDPAMIEDHLDHLPPSYLLHYGSNDIKHHLESIRQFNHTKPVIRFVPHVDRACLNVVLVCRDKMGLFNRFCTAVYLENFSIEEARLNTRSDQIVVNNFVIRDAIGKSAIQESRRQLLQERIERILTSEGELPPLPKSLSTAPRGRSSFENQVKVSNDASARFTVVIVRCRDRFGLLQNLSSVFSSEEINVHFARIVTEGDRVTDVFYITNSEGEKILDDDKVTRLKQGLLAQLESDVNNG